MKVNVEIPDYSDEEEWETRNGITLVGGFTYEWTEPSEIAVTIEDNAISIIANEGGLISLANHCLNLAQEAVPDDYYLLFDEYNYSLEEGSEVLAIQKNSLPERYLKYC